MTYLHQQFERLLPGQIISLAGIGYREGIPAREADAGWPMGVVRRPDGDLLVADLRGHRIWRIDADGILHSFAGDGIPGNDGDGGPASQARVNTPHDFFLDKAGNLYFSQLGGRGPDEGPNTIRRIDYQTGIITTVVGSGRVGRGGEGGPALEAETDTTTGIAVDDEGNLFVCNKWDCTVKRVDAKTGIITTYAGLTGRLDPTGKSGALHTLAGFHGDGGPATEAAFKFPEHLAFDSHGHLYVCDNGNHRIRKIDRQTGVVSTVFGTGNAASTGDGGPASEASVFLPDAIFIDAHDNLYVGEAWGCRVRKVDARTGIVSTVVGTGMPGLGEAGRPGPETDCNPIESGLWVDPDGAVFYSDSGGVLRRVDPHTGLVSDVLGGTSIGDGGPCNQAVLAGPRGLAVGPDGQIYVAESQSSRVRVIDPITGVIRTVAGSGARAYGGDTGLATEAYLYLPGDIAVDSRGRLLIVDGQNNRLRRVDETGVITTIAGTGDVADRGDGGPALGVVLNGVRAVALGPDGAVHVSDSGRIRRIDPTTGRIKTVVGAGIAGYSGDNGPAQQARIGSVAAMAFDAAGHLFFADASCHVVRKVDGQGIITTVAGCGVAGFSPDGTPALVARLHKPQGLAVSHDGTVYVSDTRNNRVRRITADRTLETVAGSDTPGDTADGPAIAARLNEPHGLCFYGPNILLISDHNNNRIKAVKLVR